MKVHGRRKLLLCICLPSFSLANPSILFLGHSLAGVRIYFYRILTQSEDGQLSRTSRKFQRQIGTAELSSLMNATGSFAFCQKTVIVGLLWPQPATLSHSNKSPSNVCVCVVIYVFIISILFLSRTLTNALFNRLLFILLLGTGFKNKASLLSIITLYNKEPESQLTDIHVDSFSDPLFPET